MQIREQATVRPPGKHIPDIHGDPPLHGIHLGPAVLLGLGNDNTRVGTAFETPVLGPLEQKSYIVPVGVRAGTPVTTLAQTNDVRPRGWGVVQ